MFEAIKHTRRRRVGRVMRLLSEMERRARRLEADTPVVGVGARAKACLNLSVDKDDRRYRRVKRERLFQRAA